MLSYLLMLAHIFVCCERLSDLVHIRKYVFNKKSNWKMKTYLSMIIFKPNQTTFYYIQERAWAFILKTNKTVVRYSNIAHFYGMKTYFQSIFDQELPHYYRSMVILFTFIHKVGYSLELSCFLLHWRDLWLPWIFSAFFHAHFLSQKYILGWQWL